MAFIKGDDHYLHINKASLIKMRWELSLTYWTRWISWLQMRVSKPIGGTNFASHWCPSTWDWMCVHNFNYQYHATWQCLWCYSGMLPCFYLFWFCLYVVIFYWKEGKICLMQAFAFHLCQKDVFWSKGWSHCP